MIVPASADRRPGISSSLVDLATASGDRDALVSSTGSVLDYAGLLDAVQRAAASYVDRGIGAGRRVAIEANELDWNDFAVVYLGAVWVGAVPVLTPEVAFAALRGQVDLVVGTDVAGRERSVRAVELMAGSRRSVVPHLPDPSAVLDVTFTSGTSGEWKEVATTHSQWTDTTARSARGGGVLHGGVPAASSAGAHGILLNYLLRGVRAVWCASATDLARRLSEEGTPELHTTPQVLTALARALDVHPHDLGRLRIVKVVGGPIPIDVGRQLLREVPHVKLVSLYGLTEAGSAMTIKIFDPDAPNSIGRPLPGTRVAVFSESGVEVPAGTEGLLAIRGVDTPDFVTDSAVAAKLLSRGWILTSDVVVIDRRGEIHLTGRLKDLIYLPSGRRPPRDLENQIRGSVPLLGVSDILAMGRRVVGDWDEYWLVIETSDERLFDEAALSIERADLQPQPDQIVWTRVLPRNRLGKVVRRLIDFDGPSVVRRRRADAGR